MSATLDRIRAQRAILAARDAGGIAILLAQVIRALIPPSMDGRELLRNLEAVVRR